MISLLNTLSKNDRIKLESKLKNDDERQLVLVKSLEKSKSKKDFEKLEHELGSTVEINKIKRDLEKSIFDVVFGSKITNYFSSEYEKNDILIKKNLILAKFALTNKLYPTAKKILIKSLKLSIDFEMFNNALEASHSLLMLNGRQRNKRGISEYIKVTETYNNKRNITHDSEMIFAKAMLFYDSSNTDEFLAYCLKFLPKLKKNMKSIDSSIISYFYYDLMSKYNMEKHNSKKSLKFVNKLMILLEKKNHLFSKRWIGDQKLKLADIYLFNGQYSEGLKHIKDALPLLKSNRYKYSQALDTYYHLTLNAGFHDKRIEILSMMKKLKISSIDPFYSEKIKFYTSAYHFSLGEKDEALEILQKLRVLNKDKKGWGLGVKLLEIMALYDLGMIELLDYKLHNFRMYIFNQKIEEDHRLKAIYACLRVLRKNKPFGKVLTPESFSNHYLNLAENQRQFQWNPKGYETIRFDLWIKQYISL